MVDIRVYQINTLSSCMFINFPSVYTIAQNINIFAISTMIHWR